MWDLVEMPAQDVSGRFSATSRIVDWGSCRTSLLRLAAPISGVGGKSVESPKGRFLEETWSVHGLWFVATHPDISMFSRLFPETSPSRQRHPIGCTFQAGQHEGQAQKTTWIAGHLVLLSLQERDGRFATRLATTVYTSGQVASTHVRSATPLKATCFNSDEKKFRNPILIR